MRNLTGILFWAATFGGVALASAQLTPLPGALPPDPASPPALAPSPEAPAAMAAPSAAAPANTTTPGAPREMKYQNAVAAVVNDKIITFDQVRKELAPLEPTIFNKIYAKYGTSQQDQAKKEYGAELEAEAKDLLHLMVDRILTIDEFHKSGASIPKSYLDQEFDDSLVKRFNGDREEYLRYLQQNGLTEREYRKQLEEDIIVGYMKNQLRDSQSGVSPDRIVKMYDVNKQKYYQEAAVKLRQITLKPLATESTALLLDQAKHIVEQARGPKGDFAQLALTNSQDEFKDVGGLSGWHNKGDLVKELDDAAFALKPGEVSDPIVFGNNVYIFKCEDKRDQGIQPLEAVRQEIEGQILIQDAKQAEEKWLEKLRKNAYVKYYM